VNANASAEVALDRTFHALADAGRRAMIDLLAARPASVSALAGPLSMRLPAAVKHLQVLEAAGLVDSEKAGRVRTYRMAPAGLGLVDAWLAARRRMLNAQFDRLERVLAEDDVEAVP
jgi:DNA-binding transcriptional ArsR family regulator